MNSIPQMSIQNAQLPGCPGLSLQNQEVFGQENQFIGTSEDVPSPWAEQWSRNLNLEQDDSSSKFGVRLHVLQPDQKPKVSTMSATNVFDGPAPWLANLRRRQLCANSFSNSELKPCPLSCWIHLPDNDLTWIGKAAGLVFGLGATMNPSGPTVIRSQNKQQATLEFIKYLESSWSLTKPGFYEPDDEILANEVQCIVLPILDTNIGLFHRRPKAPTKQTDRRLQQSVKAYEPRTTFPEQTLDEYCYRLLTNGELNKRDKTQVVCRYSKRTRKSEAENMEDVHGQEHVNARAVPCQHSNDKNSLDNGRILVVTQFWVWKFGDVVITNYGGASMPHLLRLIAKRFSANSHTESLVADISKSILEECVKHEPFLPGQKDVNARVRLLDGAGAFSSEIAWEAQKVTESYNKYQKVLGSVEESFRKAFAKQTNILLQIDDILSELAMIRRIQEDMRLVCMDYCDNRTDRFPVDTWAQRGKSKLERLENEASRVRESLVTLLSLQQREVNVESLINSELQNQILFVFTAATVFFAPLSWVSSLMALNIQGFTPKGSAWTMEGTATAHTVTVVGFAILMLLCLLIWRFPSLIKKYKKKTQEGGFVLALRKHLAAHGFRRGQTIPACEKCECNLEQIE